jgi:hypothetical protein
MLSHFTGAGTLPKETLVTEEVHLNNKEGQSDMIQSLKDAYSAS